MLRKSYTIFFLLCILFGLFILLIVAGYLGINKFEGFDNGAGMKLFSPVHNYDDEIAAAKNLTGVYEKPVTFHCYWDGGLNEKHVISMKSCYYFNVLNRRGRKIILWTTNDVKEGGIYDEVSKYAEIKRFDVSKEIVGTAMEGYDYSGANQNPSFFSDIVRYTLLHKYGGCWFDLDVLFLRCFDPLFVNFEDEVVVYQWDNQNYPNGAIFISLMPNSDKLTRDIEFIRELGRGWGFQEAGLTFDLPMDYLVLPCGWFDPFWREDNPFGLEIKDFLKENNAVFSFDTFNGAFAFHWHNQWNDEIEAGSPMEQLDMLLDKKLL